MFTSDILQMLFEEIDVGMTFEQWVADSNYNSSMTDQEIYAILPPDMYPYLAEFGLNASWMHEGIL